MHRRAGGLGDIPKRASSVRFGIDMPWDVLRSPDDGLSLPESTLTRFFAALEGAGLGHLPATLDDLAGAGLPSSLLDELRALVATGYAEADVVHAFYEALAAMVADGTIAAPVSRQLMRALRRHLESCFGGYEASGGTTIAALG